MSPREKAARAVYRLRPFRTAMTRDPFEVGVMDARLFEFDEAPAYYVSQCYEIVDAVLTAALRPALPRAMRRGRTRIAAAEPTTSAHQERPGSHRQTGD